MSFDETVSYIWNNSTILTILALIFAPLFGGILMSLDRRITARMQGRMGPPFLQPFYDLFKLFGDTTRMRILFSLFESEMCVCDIAEIVGISVSAVSHQLRILKQSELVRFRRDGKTIYYSLADDHVRTIIGQGTEHINE